MKYCVRERKKGGKGGGLKEGGRGGKKRGGRKSE